MRKNPNLCQIPGCLRYGDGDMLYRGNAICSVHEKIHQKGDGTYIWKKLGLYKDMKENELQIKLN